MDTIIVREQRRVSYGAGGKEKGGSSAQSSHDAIGLSMAAGQPLSLQPQCYNPLTNLCCLRWDGPKKVSSVTNPSSQRYWALKAFLPS